MKTNRSRRCVSTALGNCRAISDRCRQATASEIDEADFASLQPRGGRRRDMRGFNMIELVIAMALSAVVLSSVASMWTSHVEGRICQWSMLEKTHRMRAALRRIAVDVRIAGMNPLDGDVVGLIRDPNGDGRDDDLRLRYDSRGRSVHSPPDGDADDPTEDVYYRYDAVDRTMRRNNQPLVDHVIPNPSGDPVFRFVGDDPPRAVEITLTLAVSCGRSRPQSASGITLKVIAAFRNLE